LVTIDVQRDVSTPAVRCASTAAVVPRIRRLAEAFRRAGLPIVHVVLLYQADGANAEPCRRALLAEGDRGGYADPAAGTDGAELAEGVAPPAAPRLDADLLLAGGTQPLGSAEVALYKPRWGAFYNTALDAHLRALSVDTLVFCGANFPNCPRTSAYEASERDYRRRARTDADVGSLPARHPRTRRHRGRHPLHRNHHPVSSRSRRRRRRAEPCEALIILGIPWSRGSAGPWSVVRGSWFSVGR
jgi:nicotinamidase-related amidase